MRILKFAKKHQWLLMTIGILMTIGFGMALYHSQAYVLEKAKATAVQSLKSIVSDSFMMVNKIESTANKMVPKIEHQLDTPDVMFSLSREVLEENKLLKGCSVSFEPYFFKEKGKYFSCYSYNNGDSIATEQEGDDSYQYFRMDWYQIPRLLDKKYWIEPYAEFNEDGIIVKEVMTSFCQPLHDKDGNVIGVLSTDLPLKWLSDFILSHHPFPQSYCMLLGRGGTYIVHPDSTKLLYETILTPTLDGDFPELKTLGRAMIAGETGTVSLALDGVNSHVFYMPFARTGWSLALVCPDEVLLHDYYILSWILIVLIVVAIIMMLAPIWTRFVIKADMSPSSKKASLLLTLFMLGTTLFFTACEQRQQVAHQKIEADSLMNAAYKMHDYDRLLSLADLHESTHALSPMKAHYWRGYAYSRLRKMRLAEREWKKAVDLDINDDDDLKYYSKSANRLAGLLYMKFDYEGTMRIAVPAMKLLQEKEFTMSTDYANLQTFLGCCQLRLGHKEDAANSFALAWQHFLQATESSDDIANYTSAIIGIVTITDTYIQTGHDQEAKDWTDRFDSMLLRYRQHPQADDNFIDKQWARLNFYRACILERQNERVEAQKAYQVALTTKYAKTSDGQIEATSYLMEAGRWNEAADKFTVLERQLQRYDMQMTLDNIRTFLIPKFMANASALRTDTALVTGKWICHALDSAIVKERQNNALELATLYDMQQKETEIIEQQASLSQQRFLSTAIILVLVIFGFGLFIYFRHQSSKRLKKAYHHLEMANARAEESSRMKSDFIQQISHEIRTPLNVLSGFTQIITSPDMEIDEEMQEDINWQIIENTNRITGLVNKMLELSDANSQKVIKRQDDVSAELIATDAIDASGIATAQHLQFDLQITEEAFNTTIHTNRRAATRALSLLLDNARKFTDPSEAHYHDNHDGEQKKATLRVYTDAEYLRFCIEDNGIGVPSDEAERIFNEFVQLDEYYNGTGIGLTVARSQARRLGGDIWLDPTYSGGARFIYILPLAKEDTDTEDETI